MIRAAATCLALVLLVGPAATTAPAVSPVSLPASAGAAAPAALGARPTRYAAPVDPLRVVRPFEPPPGPYAAGHRGVDLAATPRQLVRAAADGTVTFAGQVAGRGVVVLAHADGVRTEYEPVTPSVRTGQPVARGQPIGRVAGRHGACAPGRCLHWGARRGAVYVDPLTLLRRLGPVRLLPWT